LRLVTGTPRGLREDEAATQQQGCEDTADPVPESRHVFDLAAIRSADEIELARPGRFA
jgi:hypothetical protein